MAMSREEFRRAFNEIISEEFSDIPRDEASIPLTFSRRFERKMERLIRNQRKPYWFLINTASKRAAVIIAAVLTLFTAGFSIKAIREPIVKFIKEIYHTFIAYSAEGDVIDKIERRYYLNYLPEGFKLTNEFANDASVIMKYENSSDKFIRFTQNITERDIFNLDNEHGEVKTENINGMEVNFYADGENRTVFWTKDGYFFEIFTNSDIDSEIFEKMILSVE